MRILRRRRGRCDRPAARSDAARCGPCRDGDHEKSPERAAWLEGIGAEAVVVDAYDADAVRAAVLDARPDILIHQLTDLALGFGPDDVGEDGAPSRGRNAEPRRCRACRPDAAADRTERRVALRRRPAPTPREPPAANADHECPGRLAARGHRGFERLVTQTSGLDGVVLRYGFFYGPNTAWEADTAPSPRVSVRAAARATLLAVDRGPAGIYNVVDDDETISNRRARDLLAGDPERPPRSSRSRRRRSLLRSRRRPCRHHRTRRRRRSSPSEEPLSAAGASAPASLSKNASAMAVPTNAPAIVERKMPPRPGPCTVPKVRSMVPG